MTEASLKTYLKQIEEGRAQAAQDKILRLLMSEGMADTYELSKAAGCSVNTIGARMKTIQVMGLAYKLGSRVKEIAGKKRTFSLYLFISNEENRPKFGKVYRLELARDRLRSILNHREDYSSGMATRAEAELEGVERRINRLMVETEDALTDINSL